MRTILLTSHRRENHGEPLEQICRAILELVEQNTDIQVIYPVHLNPNVRNTVFKYLQGKDRIILTEPLEYAPFASLMKQSDIITSMTWNSRPQRLHSQHPSRLQIQLLQTEVLRLNLFS